MYRLINRAVSVRMKKGNRIDCRRGQLWMTLDGKDFILKPGDISPVPERRGKAVLMPLGAGAEFSVVQ